MGLLPGSATVNATRLSFGSQDLSSLKPHDWNRLRGSGMGLILQDPKFSLNPAHRVGRQVEQTLLLHTRLPATQRRERALDMLAKVGLSDPERVYASYPAELSGGMGQRVMITAMLINRPNLVIADEPTSALDVSVQAEILNLLNDLKRVDGMTLVLVSHDPGVIGHMCDRGIKMAKGTIQQRLDRANLSAL
jgi:peptide/nickel transport system ATP-binding protein